MNVLYLRVSVYNSPGNDMFLLQAQEDACISSFFSCGIVLHGVQYHISLYSYYTYCTNIIVNELRYLGNFLSFAVHGPPVYIRTIHIALIL